MRTIHQILGAERVRYLVSYDLNKPGQAYERLWQELQTAGAKRVLDSQWVVRVTNMDAAGLRDYFWRFMDQNDRLLVVNIDSSNWAGTNLKTKISTF